MSDRPPNDDVKTFLHAFTKLNDFEATTRLIRNGRGAFREEELRRIQPPVSRVLAWLKGLCGDEAARPSEPS